MTAPAGTIPGDGSSCLALRKDRQKSRQYARVLAHCGAKARRDAALLRSFPGRAVRAADSSRTGRALHQDPHPGAGFRPPGAGRVPLPGFRRSPKGYPPCTSAPVPTPPAVRPAAGAHRPVRRANGAGSRRPGARAPRRRRHRPGHGRLPASRSRAGGRDRLQPGGHRDGHARWARHLHAGDDQGHPRLARAGGHLCRPGGRSRGQRRHLHPLCQSHRGHGPGHQPGRGHAGGHRHRRSAAGCQAGPGGGKTKGKGCHERQGGGGCHRLHPQPGATARPQRGFRRARGHRGGQPEFG